MSSVGWTERVNLSAADYDRLLGQVPAEQVPLPLALVLDDMAEEMRWAQYREFWSQVAQAALLEVGASWERLWHDDAKRWLRARAGAIAHARWALFWSHVAQAALLTLMWEHEERDYFASPRAMGEAMDFWVLP